MCLKTCGRRRIYEGGMEKEGMKHRKEDSYKGSMVNCVVFLTIIIKFGKKINLKKTF